MATAAVLTDLHPATERALSFACWTDDPTATLLFETLRDLDKVGQRLNEAAANRPHLRSVASEVGTLIRTHKMTGRVNDWRWATIPNGGAVVGVWAELDECRTAWIKARLTAEGLHQHIGDQSAYFDRHMEVSDEAVSVEDAWNAFS